MAVSEVPPGLEPVSSVKVVATRGDKTWLPYAGRALFTNIVPVDEREGKVLLAWKTEGFGRNKYNPFTGPVTPTGNSSKAATRDLKAQSGLQAVDIAKLGKLVVVLEGNAIALDVDVFRVTSWRGDVVNVDDIRPCWFAMPTGKTSAKLPILPFDQLFADNEIWLPLLTAGKYFIGRVDYASPSPGEDVGPILRYWFATV
ncbi:hypothetical protein FRB93_004766 [Tulasnella sp. JGI-2019a]|nr:hypothetical protein FRB93_004766 [Tulasnella sp. JGI-2019a]